MQGDTPPTSVLFVCNLNAVRSAMAEALTKKQYGDQIFIDSAGLEVGELDPFAVAVLAERDIDLSAHKPKKFTDLEDTSFDLVVCLTQEAHEHVTEARRASAGTVEHWETSDPTLTGGAREQRLEAYRQLADELTQKIEARLGPPNGSPQ